MNTEPRPTTLLRIEREALDLAEDALGQDLELQTAWLNERTADSARLRARAFELLALARDEPALTDVLPSSDSPPQDSEAADLSEALTRNIDPDEPGIAPSPHHRGDQIGNYRIDQEIGRGGMGVVYRAHRADESFDLAVALKVMQALPGAALQRFEAERQILARLSHPNIARILDGGHTEHGSPYLVMELAEGAPINRYCDEHRLSLKARIELFLTVCEAVLHAHRRLVVHRDLKPDNILVTDEGEAKLLDFGIAKLIDLDQPGQTATLFGMGAMTPEYASPEQVRQEPITVGSDVYSLGVVLFELLTGRRPYQLEDRSPRHIERMVCETRPPTPSNLVKTFDRQAENAIADLRATSGERLERDLAGDLDAVVMAALEKDASDRYGSVEELADDLRNVLASRPVTARAQTPTYLLRRFLARNKQRVALLMGILLLTLGGISVGIVQSLRAASEGRRALLEAKKLERTNEFLNALFSAPDPMYGMGKETTVAELLDTAVERLDDEEPMDEAGALLVTIGETYRNLGLEEKAVEVLERAEAENVRVFGEDHVETSLARQMLAIAVSDLGETERAVELLEAALPALERAQYEELAVVQSQYATALLDVGERERAESLYKQLRVDALAQDPADEGDVIMLNNYGVFLLQSNRREEANALFQDAATIHRDVGLPPSPLFASLLANLAGYATLERRTDEAEPLYLESLALCDDLLGPDHPQTLTTLASLVDFYQRVERLEEAASNATQLLERATTALPEGHPILAYAQVVYAGVRIEQGLGADAEPQIRAAIASRTESLPEGHWLIASAENLLGASFNQQGRFQEAETLLTRTYATLLEAVGEDHDKVRQAAEWLEQAKSRSSRARSN